MKIHPAELSEAGGEVTVTYRFETPTRPDCGGALWFRAGAENRRRLAAGPEPAVAALAFLAMVLGEDIETAQPVSPRFQYGFGRFVEHFLLWLPELRPVRLAAPGLVRAAPPCEDAVAACFSGGVDSFHTLYDHLGAAAPNPDFRLTHLFFAHGFDIPLQDPSYADIASEYEALAGRLGLGFLRLSTNVREILEPHLRWVMTHGACIAACALLLAGGLRRFIVPSTNRQSLLFVPCGSNPITDPMLGSESLEIVHHGTHCSRIRKILAIADRTEAQRHLRVCWQNKPGVKNCGRCVKCLKTMMPLSVAGALGRFPVFPPLPPWNEIPAACFAPLDLSRTAPEQSYADELRALAAARGIGTLPRF